MTLPRKQAAGVGGKGELAGVTDKRQNRMTRTSNVPAGRGSAR